MILKRIFAWTCEQVIGWSFSWVGIPWILYLCGAHVGALVVLLIEWVVVYCLIRYTRVGNRDLFGIKRIRQFFARITAGLPRVVRWMSWVLEFVFLLYSVTPLMIYLAFRPPSSTNRFGRLEILCLTGVVFAKTAAWSLAHHTPLFVTIRLFVLQHLAIVRDWMF